MPRVATTFDRSALRRPRAARRASLFMGVMVCLILCTLLAGTLMKSIVAVRRGDDRFVYCLQSLLLADAGVQRALAKLSADPAYEGESWEIPPDTLGQSQPAVVQIRVQPHERDAGARRILVESHYPTDPQRRVVSSREIVIPGPEGGES